jgi:hypothetical protein
LHLRRRKRLNEVEPNGLQRKRIEKLYTILDAANAAGDDDKAFLEVAAEAIQCDIVIEVHKLLGEKLLPIFLDRSDLAVIMQHSEFVPAFVCLSVAFT